MPDMWGQHGAQPGGIAPVALAVEGRSAGGATDAGGDAGVGVAGAAAGEAVDGKAGAWVAMDRAMGGWAPRRPTSTKAHARCYT